jgi:hypothetical protein
MVENSQGSLDTNKAALAVRGDRGRMLQFHYTRQGSDAIFTAVALDQGFTNIRTRPNDGSRGHFDRSRCESQNIKIYGRRCKTSPTAVTCLNCLAKYFRSLTCFFSVQGHLIQTATKGKGFFNWKFSYKYLYCFNLVT